MRKPLIIAAVAGAAAVITVGAISLNGNSKATVDPVAGAPKPAVTEPNRVTRPPRLDNQTDAIPQRPQQAQQIETAATRPEDEGREGRGDRRRRPGLGDRPMSAEDWTERYAEMAKRREDFMKRFDVNGDGEITEEERAAIGEYFRERRREQMLERMTDRFDADGDGVLNDEERLLAEAEIEAEMEARSVERQARMTERFDTDGDGKLSEAENQAAREQFSRGGRGGNWQQAIQKYDQDGDGQLNLDESYNAYLDQFDQRTRREFVRRFDGNADGGVDASDFNAFLERYKAKDESADVNGDGIINERDVEQFRDLMIAVQP